jgi:hypothetical protein
MAEVATTWSNSSDPTSANQGRSAWHLAQRGWPAASFATRLRVVHVGHWITVFDIGASSWSAAGGVARTVGWST